MIHDIRLALLRTLHKNPSFTAIVVLTLTVGIGATTAMFSVVDGVLLRPLDYANAPRMVQLNTSRRDRGFPRLTGPDLADILAGASTLDRDTRSGNSGVACLANRSAAGVAH